MALYYEVSCSLRVMKPVPGSKSPGIYAVDGDDVNKFDFAHAKLFFEYEPGTSAPTYFLVDTTSYYP